MQPTYVFNRFLGRDEPTWPHRRYNPADQLVFSPLPNGLLVATLGAPLLVPQQLVAIGARQTEAQGLAAEAKTAERARRATAAQKWSA